MPKRSDIKSVLIIGAGPIVIGQACEFDYSGAQACKALMDEGIKLKNKPVFSVQYHPESNPGPQDSHYLFNDFIKEVKKYAKKKRY